MDSRAGVPVGERDLRGGAIKLARAEVDSFADEVKPLPSRRPLKKSLDGRRTAKPIAVSLHGEADWFDKDRVTFLNRDVVLAGFHGRNLDHDFVRGLGDDDRFV